MIILIATLVVTAILVVFQYIQNQKLNIKLKQSTLALRLEQEHPGSGKPICLEGLSVGLNFKAVGQMADEINSDIRYLILRSFGENNTLPEVVTLRVSVNEQRLLFKHRDASPDVLSVFNHAPNRYDKLTTIFNNGKICLLVTHAVVSSTPRCRLHQRSSNDRRITYVDMAAA